MMRKKKLATLEAVHETAKDLYEAGVMDLVTMREFDRLRLPAIDIPTSEEPNISLLGCDFLKSIALQFDRKERIT